MWAHLSMHDLRRTWATSLKGEDVDAMIGCDWGGWSDLERFLEHYRGDALTGGSAAPAGESSVAVTLPGRGWQKTEGRRCGETGVGESNSGGPICVIALVVKGSSALFRTRKLGVSRITSRRFDHTGIARRLPTPGDYYRATAAWTSGCSWRHCSAGCCGRRATVHRQRLRERTDASWGHK